MENDRRSSPRMQWPLEIEFWCEGTHHTGRIEDLSEGGIYIYTGQHWPASNKIEFRFFLPDGWETPIRGEGNVAWTEPMGFGLRFEQLDHQHRDRISSFIESEHFQGSGCLAAKRPNLYE